MAVVSLEGIFGSRPELDDVWASFPGSVLLTLIQGISLNLVLATIALATYGILRMFREPTVRSRDACISCGFDRRMHDADQPCPECGSRIGGTDAVSPVPARFSNAFLIGVIILVTTTQAILYFVAGSFLAGF